MEIRERAGVADSSARDVLSTMLRDVLASPYTMVGAMLDLGQLGHDYSGSRIKTQIAWAFVVAIVHRVFFVELAESIWFNPPAAPL